MTDQIAQLRNKRAFYERLGKRKKVAQIDAILIPLVTEQVKQENLVTQIRQDIEWLAGNRERAA